MSVALKKVKGISSVDVTLKRGVAHITLEEHNAVSLPQLRRIIKDAGYATRDAAVTVRGTLALRNGRPVLDVTGTSTSLILEADPAAPAAMTDLRKVAGGTRLEIAGTIDAPGATAQQQDTLRLRSFTINP